MKGGKWRNTPGTLLKTILYWLLRLSERRILSTTGFEMLTYEQELKGGLDEPCGKDRKNHKTFVGRRNWYTHSCWLEWQSAFLDVWNFPVQHVCRRNRYHWLKHWREALVSAVVEFFFFLSLPKSAMQHCPFFFTRMFLLFRSRWAMADFPWVPNISMCKCARPLAMDNTIRRQLTVSRVVSWR